MEAFALGLRSETKDMVVLTLGSRLSLLLISNEIKYAAKSESLL